MLTAMPATMAVAGPHQPATRTVATPRMGGADSARYCGHAYRTLVAGLALVGKLTDRPPNQHAATRTGRNPPPETTKHLP